MPRTYSERFLRGLHDDENPDNNLGIELAKMCVKANIPMVYVAKAVGVSKLSVFHWFRGRQIRATRRRSVYLFMAELDRDLKEGILPAPTMTLAKAYMERLLGQAETETQKQ